MFADGAAHATGFAVMGLVVYLMLRRWSPAAGAQAAVAVLTVMALVWALASLPLPGWDMGRVLELASLDSPAAAGIGAIAGDPGDRTLKGAGDGNFAPSSPDHDAVLSGRPTSESVNAILRRLARLAESSPQAGTRMGWTWRNWLAVAVLSSIGLGFLRLASGLLAMRALRRRSVLIEDQPLLEELAVLRAEMRCVRPVEVRQSGELRSPATIGVQRPVILIPDDWKTWDEAERRAVLAHELAHVCRGDFLAGLLAQLSVALQFYHPLAHWMLSRHRLDQELAADAWSARVSGGNLPYLTVLARMALRQDDRAVTWPARAFLPSRGTLVRRIEMLRSKRPVRHARLSGPIRLLTPIVLAGLGLLVASLRPHSAAGTPQAPKGQEGASRVAPAPGSFDLSYLPAETRVVLALQPAAILGRPEMAPLVEALEHFGPPGAKLPVKPEAVAQVLLFWEGNVEVRAPGRGTSLDPAGAIIHLAGPEASKDLVGRLLPEAEAVRHAGQVYYRPGQGSRRMSAYLPDDRTLVVAREDLLLTLIDDRNSPAPEQTWGEVWKQVDKGAIAAAIDARWLRREYNRVMAASPAGAPGTGRTDPRVEMISPLIEKVHSYALGVNFNGDIRCELIARAGRVQDLKAIGDTLQAVLTLARNAVPALRQEAAGHSGNLAEVKGWAVATLSQLVENASIEAAGQTVRLKSSAPVDKAAAGRAAGTLLGAARSAAGRAERVNHLKQIGLAFHNYADANGHFPTPVLMGGKNKNVPYSWRVALLPYLEGNDLYRAYNFDESWDGPNNSKLLERMPQIYGPGGPGGSGGSNTCYFVLTGPETILGKPGGTNIPDITDGTSNTLLAVEADRPVPWTKPEDIPFDPNGALPKLGGFDPEGFNALFGDGSVRLIKATILPHILKALITRNGGEVIDYNSF
jgi:hypothetical protein